MQLENDLAAQVTHSAMGTVMSHKAYGVHGEVSLAAACQEIRRIELLLSRFLPTSEISQINDCAGINKVSVSRDTYSVVAKAVEFSRRCNGCFDVTIEPLVNLWREAGETLTTPDVLRIRQTLTQVDYRDVVLDPWELTIGLNHIGQSIDLGGIGKGYAGDQVVRVVQEFGVTSAHSNLGGNVVTIGTRPDGSPWEIGIQHPRQENQLVGVVSVEGQSVVTSGDYQRYYTDKQGIRQHHILDPRTGYPADAGLISVTVVAEKSLTADALSTIVFVAGMEKGLEILKDYPRCGAILVDSEMNVFVTQGLKNCFQAANNTSVTFLN